MGNDTLTFTFTLKKNENSIALISVHKTTDISSGLRDVSLKLQVSGCIGFFPLEGILSSIDTHNTENTLSNIAEFIEQLNAEYIVVYCCQTYGATAALLVFTKLCKTLGLYCIAVIPTVFRFEGRFKSKNHNKSIDILDADEFYSIDETKMLEIIPSECNMRESIKINDETHEKVAFERFEKLTEKLTIWNNISYFTKTSEPKTIIKTKNTPSRRSDHDFENEYYNSWARSNGII